MHPADRWFCRCLQARCDGAEGPAMDLARETAVTLALSAGAAVGGMRLHGCNGHFVELNPACHSLMWHAAG